MPSPEKICTKECHHSPHTIIESRGQVENNVARMTMQSSTLCWSAGYVKYLILRRFIFVFIK